MSLNILKFIWLAFLCITGLTGMFAVSIITQFVAWCAFAAVWAVREVVERECEYR